MSYPTWIQLFGTDGIPEGVYEKDVLKRIYDLEAMPRGGDDSE